MTHFLLLLIALFALLWPASDLEPPPSMKAAKDAGIHRAEMMYIQTSAVKGEWK